MLPVIIAVGISVSGVISGYLYSRNVEQIPIEDSQ